jgi:hypothetical protein
MAAVQQELKNEHSQSKIIVFSIPPCIVERPALQLWRCILGLANGTGKGLSPESASHLDLERVGIDQGHHRSRGDHDITLVDVTDHVTALVERFKGNG